MNRHSLIFAAALIVGGFGALGIQPLRTELLHEARSQTSREMGLIGIMFGLGRDYDCFFTVEGAWQESEPAIRLESWTARRSSRKGGLIWELEQLREIVPDFIYEIEAVNPRIVHVIDGRLKLQKGYALDATITRINFTGKVNELPDAIGRQGIPIALPPWQSTHEQRDGSTIVDVKGEGVTVRSALSTFINLDGRGRILWISRTKLEQGAMSYVFYPWPGNMVER